MFLKYNKNEKLEFNYKRACGLWLILVAAVILVATFVGGKQIINMQVFCIGYIVSFFSVNMNKKVLNKLSDGSSSEFQRKVSLYAIILLLVLMSLLGGPFFADENWRLIWLGALMATTIHFCTWKINDLFRCCLYFEYFGWIYFLRRSCDCDCIY